VKNTKICCKIGWQKLKNYAVKNCLKKSQNFRLKNWFRKMQKVWWKKLIYKKYKNLV